MNKHSILELHPRSEALCQQWASAATAALLARCWTSGPPPKLPKDLAHPRDVWELAQLQKQIPKPFSKFKTRTKTPK
eukprot:15028423-Heterocapsa_arctica.AAC.1